MLSRFFYMAVKNWSALTTLSLLNCFERSIRAWGAIRIIDSILGSPKPSLLNSVCKTAACRSFCSIGDGIPS